MILFVQQYGKLTLNVAKLLKVKKDALYNIKVLFVNSTSIKKISFGSHMSD